MLRLLWRRPTSRPISALSGQAAVDGCGAPAQTSPGRPRRLSPARSRRRRALTGYLLACGGGPLLFVLVFLAEGATRPGYSAWRHAVSQLSLGDHGWVNSAALVVFGLLMLGFARGLALTFPSGTGSTWGPRLVAVFGLSLIVAGLFVIDPSLDYPPGARQTYTLHGLVHALDAGPVLFGSLSAACLVFARRFSGDSHWKGWQPYSIVTAALVAGFFIACSVAAALDQYGVLSPGPGGLLQRVSLISGLSWMALLAFRLLRIARATEQGVGGAA